MNLIPRSFYLDDLFDDFLTIGTNNLKCDLYEKDNNYFVEADIPGFSKDDIKVEVEDGYLTISASKEESKENDEKNYLRQERRATSYKRKFYLGSIDEENIKAEYKDGTLKIMVPKEEEISKTRKIIVE
ncbi:MAG TPA: Hsp20/alpha crystallin family protein [Mollicutes bacterium]|jgi:HSP20 family protein|nr:Hsp20/alpha crystallin family protein [Mollicutes bacterium]